MNGVEEIVSLRDTLCEVEKKASGDSCHANEIELLLCDDTRAEKSDTVHETATSVRMVVPLNASVKFQIYMRAGTLYHPLKH